MTSALYAANPAAALHIQTLSSGCPVLVVDDFYADPDAVRAHALEGRYDSSLAMYPGVHAAIDARASHGLRATLARLVGVLAHVDCDPQRVHVDFSLVTTPAREMLAMQKHPHVDGVPLAGIVYLNPDFEIGTSFFRHRPTGLAFVRSDAERQAIGAWMQAHGEERQPETYAVGDDAVWEHLHTVAGRYNRLVMYPGTAFHSIAMRDVAQHLSLASARLTQRIFVNHIGSA